MTQPLRPEELGSAIASVVVTDTETGDVCELSTRSDSACHFFERFAAGGDSVQLRLDWSDFGGSGQPRLDADFLDPATGKHRSLKGARRRSPWVSTTG